MPQHPPSTHPTPFDLLVGLAASPSLEHPVLDEDRAAIAARIAEFDAAIGRGDLPALADQMPPRMMKDLAEEAGLSVAAMRAHLRGQMAGIGADVAIDAFAMDLDAAEFRLTPDGERAYGLIPTEVTMHSQSLGAMRARSRTLAVEDGGSWFLVRVDDPGHVAFLRRLYPEFGGVTFTPGTMERIE